MITLGAAVNDEAVLEHNLLMSPLVAFADRQVILQRGYPSAAKAYNGVLEQADGEWIVLAHQDVYLPKPWLEQLRSGIEMVESHDPNWAVIGIYGVAHDGQHVGHCWSSGLGRELGVSFDQPQAVSAIDELLIVLRRSAGLRFDEGLPGFHLYGTDIVQTALKKGLSAYVVHAPVVHNSRSVRTLRGPYAASYHFMRKKWRDQLPVATTVVTLTRSGYPLMSALLRRSLKHLRGGKPLSHHDQGGRGKDIARRLNYE